MIYVFADRTEECRSYLTEERRILQGKSRQHPFQSRADVHAALASIDDWLGKHKMALGSISRAVELDPTSR